MFYSVVANHRQPNLCKIQGEGGGEVKWGGGSGVAHGIRGRDREIQGPRIMFVVLDSIHSCAKSKNERSRLVRNRREKIIAFTFSSLPKPDTRDSGSSVNPFTKPDAFPSR